MTNKTTEVGLLKSATVVFFISCIGWLLSCARLIMIAFLFGATFAYDAYLVAFTIPEMITGLLVGVVSVTFIPIFTEHLFKDGEAKAWDFAFNLVNIVFIVGLSLTIIMVFIAPYLIKIVAPGFNHNTFQLSARLIIIIIPVILIISLSEVITRILHTYQYFAIPALSRILEVIVVIICLISLSKKYSIFSLAFGLLLGAVVRLLFQLPVLWKKFGYYRFSLNFQLPGIKKVNLIAGPAIGCMVFLRIGTVIERLLASTLKEGSISTLGYAATLSQVPSELFIGSLVVVLFPLLSKYAAEDKISDFKAILSKGIRIGSFILIPIGMLYIFFGKLIIRSLLERGQFISSATQDTSIALAVYALGLFVMTIYFFSAHACYALQEVKATIKISIFVMVLNIILKLILINYLSFIGLALATSLALIIQSGLMLRFVIKKIGSINEKVLIFSLLKIFTCSILMAGTCWMVLKFIPSHSHSLIQLAILIVTAGISYFVVSYLLQSQELSSVKDLFKKTFFQTPVLS